MMVDGVWRENISCRRCSHRHPADLSCAKAAEIAAATKPKTVPCRWCSKETPMTGTEMCDRCWELDHRIRGDLEIARKIFAHYVREE